MITLLQNHCSYPAFLRVDVGSGILSDELSEGNSEKVIEPSLSIGSGSLPEAGQSLYFHIQSLLIALVSILEDLCILIVYFFALEQAFLLGLVWLQFAGLNALVILFCEFEIDLHSLLPLGGVNCFYIGSVQDVSLYHYN